VIRHDLLLYVGLRSLRRRSNGHYEAIFLVEYLKHRQMVMPFERLMTI